MSKNIIRADDKHADTFDLGGALWKIQIPGSETGNQFSLVESISPPGIGSPLHRHIRADQAIYVLEGELEILADSKSLLLKVRLVSFAGALLIAKSTVVVQKPVSSLYIRPASLVSLYDWLGFPSPWGRRCHLLQLQTSTRLVSLWRSGWNLMLRF